MSMVLRGLSYKYIETGYEAECARILQEKRKQLRIPQFKIDLIRKLKRQGLSTYQINSITGVSRNTIMKYLQ
jgi:hypothetical protein